MIKDVFFVNCSIKSVIKNPIKMLQIELPVKPFVKQWLVNYSLGSGPVEVRKNSMIGKLICTVVQSGGLIPDLDTTPDPKSEQTTLEIRMEGHTVVLPKNCSASRHIMQVIGQTVKRKSIEELEADGTPLKCVLLWDIPEYALTPARLLMVGEMLEEMFELALTFYSFGRMSVSPIINQSVVKFFEEYNINQETLKLDTAAKMVTRARQKQMALAIPSPKIKNF